MNKKGAIELSISTIVIIVLAMSMLILGLVLVRSIFFGATESVDLLNAKSKAAIIAAFGDGDKDVTVSLGADSTAKIKPGSENFGIAIGARTLDGSAIGDRGRLQYKLSLSEVQSDNCIKDIGKTNTEKLFQQQMDTWSEFDEYDGDTAYARVIVNVPKGTELCTQKVNLDVKDTETAKSVGGSFFIVEIVRGGIGGMFG